MSAWVFVQTQNDDGFYRKAVATWFKISNGIALQRYALSNTVCKSQVSSYSIVVMNSIEPITLSKNRS